MVDIAQAEIHRTRTAIDQAGIDLLLRIGTNNQSPMLLVARRVKIKTPIKSDKTRNASQAETPKTGIASFSIQPEDSGACQDEHTRCAITTNENEGEKEKKPVAVVQGTADINASGDSSGPFATDDLDIADELSTISMTEDDHQQILEELENLC